MSHFQSLFFFCAVFFYLWQLPRKYWILQLLHYIHQLTIQCACVPFGAGQVVHSVFEGFSFFLTVAACWSQEQQER